MLILPNIRSYEKYSAIPPDFSKFPKVRNNLTIACILNEYLYADLKSECHLISLDSPDWETILKATKPSLFLAQVPFSHDHTSEICSHINKSTLIKIINLCNELNIPTALWETGEQETFDQHKDLIPLFDHIFIGHANNVTLYKELRDEKSLTLLPLGIQIHKHNPVNTTHFGRKDLMPSKTDMHHLREDIALHSYTKKIEIILDTLGIKNDLNPTGVTILTATNKPDSMETIFANYERQNYAPKEMIVILNNNLLDIEQWKARASQSSNVTVLRLDESHPLGHCLNEGIENSSLPFVSKFDDDNYYASNYLTDLMNAFSYSGTEIVGKLTYFCYFHAFQMLALMCPGMENRYVNFVSGSGLIIKREVFDSVLFGDKQRGSDSAFLKECTKKGVRMYSADRFNYVYNRLASKTYHTCKTSDELLMKSCQFIAHTEDYQSFVSI